MIKKIWNAANGNKRTFGIGIMLIGMGLKAFNVLPEEQAGFIQTCGEVIAAGGAFHAIMKSDKTKGIIGAITRKNK